MRPSQPPPAPPSNASSNSTPTISSANNTPTRGRSMSTGRDTLPPPPPPPGEMPISPPAMNGTIPGHLLHHNGSRSSSPLPSHHSMPMQIGGIDEPDPAPQDLPPPPPTPDPTPRPISPPCNIPPPPPPPPPPPVLNGPLPMPPMTNGNIAKMIAANPPKLKPIDGQLRKGQNPNIPIVDPRNDLLKAIRDGTNNYFLFFLSLCFLYLIVFIFICFIIGIKLRKVEKSEQKEVERVNALNDVASILARRVAVEFSDSDSSDSECDSEGWGEQDSSVA